MSGFRALLLYLLGIGLAVYDVSTPPEPSGATHAIVITLIVIGISIATTIALSEILRPDPKLEDAKPAGAGDFNFPTATEGRPVPLIWGRVRVTGPNVVWWGDFRQIPIRETIKLGLFSKKRIITGYQYYVGVDMCICRGGEAEVSLLRVFVGDVELEDGLTEIDEPELFGGSELGSGGIQTSIEFFSGSNTQNPSAYLSQFQSPISGQRGTAHYVFEGGWIGNTTAIKPFSFEVERYPRGLLGAATGAGVAGSYVVGMERVNMFDVNPMEVIYEAVTDTDWGMGKGQSEVDLRNFAEVAAVLFEEGNGFAITLDRRIVLSELLQLVQEQVNGILYFDRRVAQFRFRLARQDYTTNVSVSDISGGDTFNIASGGGDFSPGQVIFAEGFDNPANNGRKTVISSTDTTVVVSGVVDEVPSGVPYGGPRISALNGITDDNRLSVRDFSRQTWDGLTNQVRVSFTDRSRDYFETFARADNIANQRVQNGEIISSTINYPGCKNPTLANDLAARELRLLSFPLAKATIRTNRELWDTVPGDVVRWTSLELGFIDLAMRVLRIDYGESGGPITLTLVQDVFALEAGFFGDPPETGWTLPTQSVQAIPSNEQLVFEAPKAFIDRDVESTLVGVPNRLFFAARGQAGEAGIRIFKRNAATNPPTGPFVEDGDSPGVMLIGSLNSDISASDGNPTTTIQLAGSPDSRVIISALSDPDGASAAEIGQQLANMIIIGDEFIGFESLSLVGQILGRFVRAVGGGADPGNNLIDLTNCYRGMLDSVPRDHAQGSLVYLVYISGGLSNSPIPAGDFVQAQIRSYARGALLSQGVASTFELQMSNRYLRPYPPFRLDIGGVRFPSSGEIGASGLSVDWFRRDWETDDEVLSLTDDAEVLTPGFQAKHNHENRFTATLTDRDGLTLSVPGTTFGAGTSATIPRGGILAKTDGDLPASLNLSIEARHTVDGVTYEGRSSLDHTISTTSAQLGGIENLGTIFAGEPRSRTYTATSTASLSMTLDSAVSGVLYRKNSGGAWTAIASLSGESVLIGDEFEFRHGDNSDSGAVVGVLSAGGADVAYVVFDTTAKFEDLVAYWTMNEDSVGASPVVRDSRFGGAPALSDPNNAQSVAGYFGNALLADPNGATDLARVLTASDADCLRKDVYPRGTQEFTVSCWVRIAAGGTTSIPGSAVIWGFADFTSSTGDTPDFANRSCYLLHTQGAGFTFVFIQNNGLVFAQSASYGGVNRSLDEEKWIHIACSRVGSQVRIRLNDLIVAPRSFNRGSMGGRVLQTTDAGLTIGGGYFPFPTLLSDFTMTGLRIDDFRIYQRGLSEAEIDALAAETVPLD